MTVTEYEFIANAELLAEGVEEALMALQTKPWINYLDDAGDQHGKIVHLFPEQRLTRVTGWGLIGTIFPLLRTEGEAFEVYTVRAYGAALLIRMQSPNDGDAANFVKNRGWFNHNEGVNVRVASHPSRVGTFQSHLVGELRKENTCSNI